MYKKTALKLSKTIGFILVFILVFAPCSLTVFATELTPPEVSGAKAVCLYNIQADSMIVSQNTDEPLHTSTSAKIMTGLLACEMLCQRLNETITITEEMISDVSGNNMRLSAGEKISVNDLLYGAICGSYNDAAYVLSYVAGGNVEDFVALMNKRASELGALNTHYTNPLGYPDADSMLTTANDTLKIAAEAYQNELYMTVSSTLKHTVPANNISDERTFYNRNYLISSNSTAAYFNSKCKGMNAGYSGDLGGWSLVTVAQDDGADYICVVLGGSENEDGSEIYAYNIANTLIDWVTESYGTVKVIDEGTEIGMTTVRFTGLKTDNAPYITSGDLSVYIPLNIDAENDLVYETVLDKEAFDAPISAGTEVGELKVLYDGKVVGSCRLLLKESYEKNSIVAGIQMISDYTHSRAFIASVIFFAVSLAVVLSVVKYRFYKYNGKIRRLK